MSELELVNRYLKVPYLAGGSNPSEGLNCWGLVKAVYRDLGHPIGDLVDFAERCPKREFHRIMEFYEDTVREVLTPQKFDVVLMSVDGLLHAGVVLSKGRFLHMCKAGAGVCRLDSPNWKPKILGYYRDKKC